MTSAPSAATPAPRRGLFGWLYGHLRGLALLALAGAIVTGVLIYTGVLGIDRLDEEIRLRVEAKFAAQYPHLSVTVESAQLLHGRGIQVRGLTIRDPQADPEAADLVYIDEILAACDTNLHELLTHEPYVRSVLVRRLHLRATRRRDGTWNTMSLLPLPKFGRHTTPTTIEDSTIEILDPTTGADVPLVLKNLGLRLQVDESPDALTYLPESQSQKPLKVTGELACEHFRRLTLDGWFDPVGGAWALRGDLQDLQVSPALEGSLPLHIPTKILSLHDLHGKLTLAYEITNQGLEAAGSGLPLRFVVAGTLREARLDDPRLPHPLTELKAKVFCDDHSARLEEVTGRCGTARLYMALQREGWEAHAPLTLKGRIANLALDSALADALDDKQRALWNRFLPSGAVHADFDVRFDGREWLYDVQAQLLNVSIAFDKFPYRVTNAGGKVHARSGFLDIDAYATAGRQRITCQAKLVNPGKDFTGHIAIASDGHLPIDDRFLLALDLSTQKIVRSLEPRGEGTFHFRIERQSPEQPVQPNLVVVLRDCEIRYEKFPYPLERVQGTIIWQGGEWRFEQFSGINDAGYVSAHGHLARDVSGDQLLHLEFTAADLPLEDDLKQALPEKLQALWATLHPGGNLDHVQAIVDLNCTTRQLSVDVQGHKYVRPQMVEERAISLAPAWFPYRLDHVTGSFHYRNGDITLKGIKAQHGRTRLSADALCQLNPDGGWTVTCQRFAADRVELDHDLLAALPTKASELVSRLKLTGPIHLTGGGSITSDGRTPHPSSATWDVAIDLENGSLDAGTKLEHIHGGVRLAGSASSEGFQAQGEVAVDSMIVQGLQLTQVLGPISLDGSRVLLGAWAAQPRTGRPPRQITAKVFGGTISTDAAVAFGDEGAFEIQASLADGDLATISAELMPQRKNLSGKAQGFIKLAGTRKGRHTWNGGGVVRLRDADIYELPVMVALLKILSVRNPDTTAFTTADLDFRIQGDHIYLDRLDFHGDAITLKGSGEMDWQRQLNLQFYTMVGRDELDVPVLRPLLGEASRQLMAIQVSGTLDRPQMTRQAFPGLNETLQQIFPEAKLR